MHPSFNSNKKIVQAFVPTIVITDFGSSLSLSRLIAGYLVIFWRRMTAKIEALVVRREERAAVAWSCIILAGACVVILPSRTSDNLADVIDKLG